MMQIAQQKTQSANRVARLTFALQVAEQASKVGNRIEQERTKRKWSRPEMARRLPGVSTGNDVYRWELGKHVPRGDTLDSIAVLFGIEVADLYAGPVDEEAEESETPDPFATEPTGEAAVDELRTEMAAMEAKLLARIAELQVALQDGQKQQKPPAQKRRQKAS